MDNINELHVSGMTTLSEVKRYKIGQMWTSNSPCLYCEVRAVAENQTLLSVSINSWLSSVYIRGAALV